MTNNSTYDTLKDSFKILSNNLSLLIPIIISQILYLLLYQLPAYSNFLDYDAQDITLDPSILINFFLLMMFMYLISFIVYGWIFSIINKIINNRAYSLINELKKGFRVGLNLFLITLILFLPFMILLAILSLFVGIIVGVFIIVNPIIGYIITTTLILILFLFLLSYLIQLIAVLIADLKGPIDTIGISFKYFLANKLESLKLVFISILVALPFSALFIFLLKDYFIGAKLSYDLQYFITVTIFSIPISFVFLGLIIFYCKRYIENKA